MSVAALAITMALSVRSDLSLLTGWPCCPFEFRDLLNFYHVVVEPCLCFLKQLIYYLILFCQNLRLSHGLSSSGLSLNVIVNHLLDDAILAQARPEFLNPVGEQLSRPNFPKTGEAVPPGTNTGEALATLA